MNDQLIPEPGVLTRRIRYRKEMPAYRFPSVTMCMPFNPKMEKKIKLVFKLSKITGRVISELRDKYPGEMSELVILKWKAAIKGLNFNTHKKGLAIFISPVFEKIYYLDMDMDERIFVSESLQIRDILYSKKQSHQYHILLLGDNEHRIYLNASNSFIRIKHEETASFSGDRDGLPETPDINNEIVGEKETSFQSAFHLLDHSLNLILEHDNQPVFVFGKKALISGFKNRVQNKDTIFEYAEGNFEVYSLNELKGMMTPEFFDSKETRKKYLTQLLINARLNNKLLSGMEEVRSHVFNNAGNLLLIGKKYFQHTGKWGAFGLNESRYGHYNRFSNIKHPVDEIIEKVLESGGDVELTDDEILEDCFQIALIKN